MMPVQILSVSESRSENIAYTIANIKTIYLIFIYSHNNIQGILAQMDRFKSKLSKVPQTPRPSTDQDAVGTLLDICVQRNWPVAKYVRFTLRLD